MTWRQSGWLPGLEVVSWPQLDRHRAAHESAIAALAAEEKAGDGAEAFEALLDVVEAAVRDLAEDRALGEEAYAAAIEAAPAGDKGYTEALGRDRPALDRLRRTLVADRLHHGEIVPLVLVETERARTAIAA